MARGRPKKEINQRQFESLCGLQCTLADIADFFECSEDTIERWCKRIYGANFADIYKTKSQAGKISLRRSQFKLAEKSPAMAIWLGKQYLGQREVQGIELTGKDGDAIEMKAGVQIYLPDNQREETK